MRERRNDIVNAAINTCAWLSVDQKYVEWSKKRHGLLWIKGHPGVGKSTIMKYASEAERGRGSLVCASFFFYGGGTLIQKNPLGLFRSLLHQIVQQVPSLLLELTHIFERRCETDGDFGKKWTWHETELQDFFSTAVVEAAKTEAIRVYVDALDECGEQVATDLVTLFQGLAESLSICFSCRHYPLIALEYGLEICVENENAQDIQTFVNRELNKEHYESIRDQIIWKSAGNFQWVKLVVVLVHSLVRRGISSRAVQEEVDQIPQELSKLYKELLTSMIKHEMQESLQLMQWIHFGLRPLTLRELRTAMAVDASSSSGSIDHYVETDEAMERRVRDLSRGLAGVVQHEEHMVAQFVHQTVIDFLVDEGFDLLDRSQRAATADTFANRSHFQLSDVCIRYLATVRLPPVIREDFYGDEESIISDLDLKFPFLEYASVSWIPHAEECERENISASRLLSHFESSSFLESWYSLLRPFEHNLEYLVWPIEIVHIASRYNLVRALDFILSQSVNVNLKTGSGRTPLLLAALGGHEEVVKLLLERNEVDADLKDDQDESPLSYALILGHEKVVELLLKRNDVKADSRDGYGRSPLSYAAKLGHEKIIKLLLKRNDVETDSRDLDDRSPLSYAAEYEHEKIVELLLKRNDVEADSRDIFGQSPLFYAALHGHEKIVELFLERDDVAVDSLDLDGRSPLSFASERGHEGVLRLLIERGNADVNLKDHKGKTPLEYADKLGLEEIMKLLEQYLSQEENERFRDSKRRKL